MDRVFQRWFLEKQVWCDVRLSSGAVIACKLSEEVQFGLWWGGERYEIKQTQYFKSLLKPGCVVFDVGANVGYYSLVAAPGVGPSGRVYCFEPAQRQFDLLAENITRNAFHWVIPSKVALSDAPGEAVIHLADEHNTGSASLRPMDKAVVSERVTVTTLDDFTQANSIARLDVIKIDVEGLELAVLRGGERALDKFRPTLLLEVTDYMQREAGYSRQELFDWLQARNYLGYRIEAGGRLRKLQIAEDGTLVAFLHASRLGEVPADAGLQSHEKPPSRRLN